MPRFRIIIKNTQNESINNSISFILVDTVVDAVNEHDALLRICARRAVDNMFAAHEWAKTHIRVASITKLPENPDPAIIFTAKD